MNSRPLELHNENYIVRSCTPTPKKAQPYKETARKGKMPNKLYKHFYLTRSPVYHFSP